MSGNLFLNIPILGFNRGVVTKKLQAREDIEKFKWAAEIQTNWIPRIFGSMSVRPGTEYLHSTYNNRYARSISFTKSVVDQAIIEFTNEIFRVIVDDEAIERPSVSTAITNGSFTSNITNWTDDSDAGGSVAWKTGGYLKLVGNGNTDYGRAYQLVSVSGADEDVEHGIRIIVERNVVNVKIGSTLNGDEYFSGNLGKGTHSISITPTGDFYIQFETTLLREVLVNSVAIEAAGVMTIPTPYGADDLDYIRYDQSADVIYLACKGYKQKKIERRAVRTWSLVDYEPLDGPFRVQNTTAITLTPSDLSGNITLQASDDIFSSSHVGALFEIKSNGQLVELDISTDDVYTDQIRVTGVENSRKFTWKIGASLVATVTLQRKIDESEAWTDVDSKTTTGYFVVDDGLDNQIVYYRLAIKGGDYTSGTDEISLKYDYGSIKGIVRITDYTDAKNVDAEVIVTLGRTLASENWSEGYWSDYRGYPSAVSLHEGRLHWVGKYYCFSSVSDEYESFDANVEGDSGIIIKKIASGSADAVNWTLALNRLIIGAETSEKTLRSNSLDEILTPTNSNIKDASTVGNSHVYPVKIDQTGIFSRGFNLYEMQYDPQNADYASIKINSLCPEICSPYIIRLGVQREPETRIHCVRSDGKVAIMLYDPTEQIRAFFLYETDGYVEDVLVQRAGIDSEESVVYYTVRRVINGSTIRYREKWALESECIGGTLNKNLDCHIVKTAASGAVSGLSHLAGETVYVWGDGRDLGSYTVSSGGAITLSETYSGQVVVGLPFTADYKTVKLSYGGLYGSSLTAPKRINKLGLLLENTHIRSLQFGEDFTTMYNLSLDDGYALRDEDYIYDSFDQTMIPFGGNTNTDVRVCFRVVSLPCTILGIVPQIQRSG
jgi:hypothetical protein